MKNNRTTQSIATSTTNLEPTSTPIPGTTEAVSSPTSGKGISIMPDAIAGDGNSTL